MSIPDFKLCPSCQQKKHKSEYHTRKDRGYIYLKSYCKDCSTAKKQEDLRSDRHFDECKCGNRKRKISPNCKKCCRIPHSELFVKNCKHNRHVVKRAIIRDKVIPYKCECGLVDNWNNKPLILQLDHINGINDDNRLKNLRFLCPNCHSQTETFCGSNRKCPTRIRT
jgi:hypothetical protein